MKVLTLGLDKNILDKKSAVAKRAIAYGNLLQKYTVVVPGPNEKVELSDRASVYGISGRDKLQTFFKMHAFLKSKIKKDKYNLISIQDIYFLAWLGLSVAKKFKIKTEIQFHGLEKFAGLRKKIAKGNLKKADKIRAVSRRMKEQLVKDFGLPEEKIYIAPVAIDKHKILHDQSSINLKERYPDNFVFLTVGRLVPVKNIALQIGCVAGLNPELKVKLIIVGSGPEKSKLRALAKRLNAENRIEFRGWTDDLVGYYRTADCMLLTSNSEGYSMVVAEAVLSSLPVIMTDVGVAGELVKDNFNGLVVPVGRAKTLTYAMEKVVDNQELLNKFSTNCKNRHDKILDQSELIKLVVNNWKAAL